VPPPSSPTPPPQAAQEKRDLNSYPQRKKEGFYMPSNITAYEWLLNETTHVVYESGDNHIHEMVVGQDRIWRDGDITRQAGGPELEDAIMTGYAWPDGRTQQIAYVSPMNNNGHIHELVMLQDHAWSYEDLMAQPTGAPSPDGLTLVGYAWKTGGTKQVVYTGAAGHVHELATGVTGMWRYTDLTQVTGSPLAEGALLAAYAWEAKGTRQVVFMSGDGHIHELMTGTRDAWSQTDLTAITGAPLADGSALAAYAWERGGTKQVVYTGNNGNIYELVAGMDNTWRYVDVTSLTSSPLADGSALAAFAYETGGTKEIAYMGRDRHVYELMMDTNGTWSHTDLTQHMRAPDANNGVLVGHEWSSQFAKHIVYLDTRENPHIHSLMLLHGNPWQHRDLTDLTGAQSIV